MTLRLRRACVAAIVAIMVVMSCVAVRVARADTFVHGYLSYEVADQSVTIVSYDGNEEVVTVPAMIAGNPVNAIAAGAFAISASVTTVCLPETITSVEQGAFAAGQTVVFAHGDAGASEGNGAGDGAASDASADDDASGKGDADDSSQAMGSTVEATGVRTDDGSLVTTDAAGNLVLVDSSGNERVLDDTKTYAQQTKPDGSTTITDDAGNEVTVTDGSKVSFSDDEGSTTVVNTQDGTTTTSTEDGEQSYEVAEVGEDGADASSGAATQGEETGAEADGTQVANSAVAATAVVALAVAGVAGFVFWKRKKG